jgi:hypothetical protein
MNVNNRIAVPSKAAIHYQEKRAADLKVFVRLT